MDTQAPVIRTTGSLLFITIKKRGCIKEQNNYKEFLYLMRSLTDSETPDLSFTGGGATNF